MPKNWSEKDERQFKHIKNSAKKQGYTKKRAAAMAAATVNKQRKKEERA